MATWLALAIGHSWAGDLLRGGAAAGKRNNPAAIDGNTSAEAALARANAKDALARTTQALNAVQAMQSAARSIATGRNSLGIDPNHPGLQLPNVPDGLAPGGLQVAPAVASNPSLWKGANLPTQTQSNGQTVVNVQQTASTAVLNWQTFNIGRKTLLNFDQNFGGSQVSQWIVFNKVNDPSGVPSQILGSIQANGQVYVINANGIIFGGSSQVNTHALVASSLPINDNLITRGLLNNPDDQFLFSALSLPAGSLGPTPAFTPPTPYTPSGQPGDVVVQAGASITAPTTAAHVGGRVVLVGPNVTNAGTISTPDGQTILAAGKQVAFVAHPSDDASLRGLDVYIGAVDSGGGTATNSGLIESPRADVTIAGKTVNQSGVIDSSTSVSLNGRIDLLANYNAVVASDPNTHQPFFEVTSSGAVNLNPGSIMQILPEWASSDRVVGTQLALPSQVNIQGQAIHFAANTGLYAPNATVNVSAGNWLISTSSSSLGFTGGQIYFDPGAWINVQGSVDISALDSENMLTVQLRGTELADSPLQRTGVLRGPSITVDLRKSGTFDDMAWVGTPLADLTGYAGLVERTVGELTTAGGTVNLSAGESVIMQSGSKIDVSGGWINYQGGMVQTTRVVSGGHIYDISSATPDRVYDGIYTGTTTVTDAKYGITQTYSLPLALTGAHYDQPYLQGANAGAINITAPSMALDGTLLGRAVQGPRQANSTTANLAASGSISLTFQANKPDASTGFPLESPTPPNIDFASGVSLPPPDAYVLAADGSAVPLRADRKAEVVLSPDLLTTDGFGNLAIDNSDGNISVAPNVTLKTVPGGSITLKAANLNIRGSVTAPGGTLTFSVFDFSPFTFATLTSTTGTTPPGDPNRGVFTLGSTSTLSTAGMVADYRPGAPADMADVPPVINGGTITINAYTADLATGSVIDVSGGASISATGKRSYGNAGSITIDTGRDLNILSMLGGQLFLGSTLKGFSGAQGGSLTIQAPLIQIGGTAPTAVPSPTSNKLVYLIDGTQVNPGELLYLTPDFFSQGGFTNFTLNGLGKAAATQINPGLGGADQFLPAISIAPGTVIQPVAESWVAMPAKDEATFALEPFLKPQGLRTPVSLSFGAANTLDNFTSVLVLRGDIVMGAGAQIEADPLANVSIKGGTVAILGSIRAPGGTITISGSSSFPTTSAQQVLPLVTVDLGPQSVLSTAGQVLLTPDAYGRRIGAVLPGGTISVSGNIVAEAGALVDVSGATGLLDVAPSALAQNISAGDSLVSNPPIAANSGLNAPLYSIHTVRTRVDSSAGSITFTGAQELFTDATLRGNAGGPTAQGGSLTIASDQFLSPVSSVLPAATDVHLIVTQSGATIPGPFYPAGQTAIGYEVGGDTSLARGHFSVDSFANGGFDSLTLSGGIGAVQFSGPVSIQARNTLSVGGGGVIFANAPVTLQAPYVILGIPFQTPLQSSQSAQQIAPTPPTYGPGSLTVHASLIDVGTLSLQNIGYLGLFADNGDIRGDGTLDVAGNIELRAGQIYPATAVSFTIAAYDRNVLVAASTAGSTAVTLASSLLPPGFGVGSSLLGSTVQGINGTAITLASGANLSITSKTPVAETFAPGSGSVTIEGSGTRPLPYSAGGQLNIYASNILQGGTLRAPLGTINLGWDGTGTSPIDVLSGAGSTAGFSVPVTRQLTLGAGSVTSVSAVDPLTGTGLIIPYGIIVNGTSWVDPTGTDITAGALPSKAVNLGALSLSVASGSTIDVRGGGDLYAYNWQTGTGGTNDILGTTTAASKWLAGNSYVAGQLVNYNGATYSAQQNSQGVTPSVSAYWTLIPKSYAIVPSYEASYYPYAPFNNTANLSTNLAASDPGYISPGLAIGEKIYLGASSALPAGTYTLLPARYALLPGAVLVTPQSGTAIGTFQQPDGSSIVSGYVFNGLNSQQLAPVQATRFEVQSSAVVRASAQYGDFLGNSFFKTAAGDLGITTPRLPADSGSVVLSGVNSLQLDGTIEGASTAGGHGARIDISTTANIEITGAGGTASPGTVVLDSAKLSSFGAESLLIGGTRQTTSSGTTITVNTSSIEVDNEGTPLSAPEIILVAKNNLTLDPGAEVIQASAPGAGISGTELPLFIGNSSTPGSGDGLLLRVGDAQVAVVRSGVDSLATQTALASPPTMVIAANAQVGGKAVILDSTYGTSINPSATITAGSLALNSGQIILEFQNPGAVPTIAGVTLSGEALQTLESSTALSLLSYSSIDLYGTGTFQAGGSFALHAAEFRGFNNGGGTVTFDVPNLVLDNIGNGISPGATTEATGNLVFNTTTTQLGAGQIGFDQFAAVSFSAPGGLNFSGTGGISTQGTLSIATPFITGTKAANYTITSTGAVTLLSPNGATTSGASSGLGASLAITGTGLTVDSSILLPSGSLKLRATTGDLVVGDLNAVRLDASGTAQIFSNLVAYTDGGQISLQADTGSVFLGAQTAIDVNAQAGGGNAGSVSISASNGSFTLDGTLNGQGGANGNSGSFSLDVKSLPSVTPVDQILNAAAFNFSRTIRVRTGDVTVDGLATAQSYQLSTDQGSITVTGNGKIDASGVTGGIIDLVAAGSVTLQSGSLLTVAAQNFNAAGKGGAVSLEAGSETNGNFTNQSLGSGPQLDIQTGSTIDLSVASVIGNNAAQTVANTAAAALVGDFTGTLHLRAPQTTGNTDLQIKTIGGTIIGASSIVAEGYQVFDLTATGGAITNTGTVQAGGGVISSSGVNVEGSVSANGNLFGGNSAAITTRLLGASSPLSSVLVVEPGAEIINKASATPVSLTLSTSGTSSVTLPSTGGTIVFPNGTPGNDQITSSIAATITSASGVVTTLAANTPATLAAGSSISWTGAGVLKFASGTGGAFAVSLQPGTTGTTSSTGVATTVNTPGSAVSLSSTGSSVALSSGSRVTFTGGTPGTDKVTSTVAGTITSATGVVTTLAANTATTIAAGSSVSLNNAGALTFSSGTGGAIPLTLNSGSFSTSGAVALTPATGNLTLGTSTSTAATDWNLSTFRFGPENAPGVLTLRAAGNLVFYNSLNDGFATSANTALLLTQNSLLPLNSQSWSYRLTAGADFSAADYQDVMPLSSLGSNTGSLKLGKLVTTNGGNPIASGGLSALTSAALSGFYQVIRTGSGDITINTGRDVQLLNQFATIYTAGTVIDPTYGGTVAFVVPPSIKIGSQGNLGVQQTTFTYAAQYSVAGGNITINAGEDIEHLTQNTAGNLVADSEHQVPDDWLYRRGYVNPVTGAFGISLNGDIASTTWWIDFSNFFEGVGALGGGNVTLNAGRNVSNVDAVVPTNAFMTYKTASGDTLAQDQTLYELGGGNLSITAGNNIDAGIYYVENGLGNLRAGNVITTNSTRSASIGSISIPAKINPSSAQWLPTTLFLGKGSFDVSAGGDVLLGPVVNPFLLPAGVSNGFWRKSYFSTYASTDAVNVTSLGGNVTLRESSIVSAAIAATPILENWESAINLLSSNPQSLSYYQPWLRLDETDVTPFATAFSLLPPTLRTTAFSGDINLVGTLNLSPSPTGTIELAASGSINGLQINGITANTPSQSWGYATINLSDTNPAAIPGVYSPYAYQVQFGTSTGLSVTSPGFLSFIDQLFNESGSSQGQFGAIETQQALHGSTLLHANDNSPIILDAQGGNISGLTLFTGKSAEIVAGNDITDVAFYIQNDSPTSVTVISAGRDIIPYDANSPLRISAQATGNVIDTRAENTSNGAGFGSDPLAGDIQISGPGTLEVLAGRNIDLGTGPTNADGTGAGITSIGNARNPNLPFTGSDIIIGAGLGDAAASLAQSNFDFSSFLDKYLTADPNAANYLAELKASFGDQLGAGTLDLQSMPPELRAKLALQLFYLILRDSGRNHNDATSPSFGTYTDGFAAIDALFPGAGTVGNVTTQSRSIVTASSGDISIFAPGGSLTLQTLTTSSTSLTPPGIITQDGGNISIFTKDDVNLGISRIFTLRGGNEIIWSSTGNIAAGSSAKTVQSAPPTRVLLDPQSADVKVDLAGLATGGGIGVLATVAGVPPGNVDLIAPAGVVDAGDAGIRATGNLNISAVRILNADNIQVSGSTTGVPAPAVVAAPNIGALTSASNAASAATSAANETTNQQRNSEEPQVTPSIISVEVVGYGGGEGSGDGQ